MAINKISIENFTVFENVEIDLSDGINVFIGENGTGKTHLLKILYAFCEFSTYISDDQQEHSNSDDRQEYANIKEKIQSCFQSLKLDQLMMNPFDKKQSKQPTHVDIVIDGIKYPFGITAAVSASSLRTIGTASALMTKKNKTMPAVFIPAKEMLTHSRLEKDFIQRNLPFDITLIDILNKAGVSTFKNFSDEMRAILDKIAEIIGGRILYRNDHYYTEKPDGTLIDFAVEAEGFKKLGLIYRLIETGHLEKGSILIWDEPEANLNPSLIPDLVDIVLKLELAGVQMFFATHDYFFAKFLEVRKKKANKVVYHALYRNQNGVLCESQNDFEMLENNSIIEQSIDLYKEEVKKVME